MNSNETARSLFNNIINFKNSKRTLNWEFGYWAGAIDNWYKEGLPRIKGLPENITIAEDVLGPALPASPPPYGKSFLRDFDVSSFFDLENFGKLVGPCDAAFIWGNNNNICWHDFFKFLS